MFHIAMAILRKKSKVGEIMLLNIRLYYKVIIIKSAWSIQVDPSKSLGKKEKNSYLGRQLIFNRGSKHIQWAKDSLFNKWCWSSWIDMCRKMKLGHFLIPHTKINSKWVKDLYGRPETIKILEVNIGSKISGISCSNIFSDVSSQARKTKGKINK